MLCHLLLGGSELKTLSYQSHIVNNDSSSLFIIPSIAITFCCTQGRFSGRKGHSPQNVSALQLGFSNAKDVMTSQCRMMKFMLLDD